MYRAQGGGVFCNIVVRMNNCNNTFRKSPNCMEPQEGVLFLLIQIISGDHSH